jgi:uridine kinase
MKNLNILILCGGSGSGKTFIANMLCNNMLQIHDGIREIVFHKPMQVTTRKQRDLENPDDYYFIKHDCFSELNNCNKLTCVTHFNNNYYGTLVKNLIYGDAAWNIIVASAEGMNNTIYNISNCIDHDIVSTVIIKTALVLAMPNDGMINEHGRDKEFFKNEIYDLIQQPFDYYIPNYEEKRITLKEVIKILGFNCYE